MTPSAAAAKTAAAFTPEQEKALVAWTKKYPYTNMGLVEALRSVQEWHRQVRPEAAARVAEIFNLPFSHVWGVATFFPTFTQWRTGRKRIGVCHGLSCWMGGSDRAEKTLERTLGVKEKQCTPDGEYSWEAMECLGACEQTPALLVNDKLAGAGSDELIAKVCKGETPVSLKADTPGPGAILAKHFAETELHRLEAYKKLGGYAAYEKALGMAPLDIVSEVKKSNLRGLGGAGFPTGLKWETVPPVEKAPVRYFVVNADESEPGCYKDRVLLTRNPHQLIEGVLIGSHAIGCADAFIFIRGEYQNQYEILEKALAEAEQAGYFKKTRVSLMRGAGAYISGLDTALLETMEGKKAWPRQPPPFPTVAGLMAKPTVVNNVETVSMLPFIVREGGEAFAKLGSAKNGGTVLFSVSGHVEKPGVYEVPMGSKLRDVLALAGGVKGGRPLKAVIPGGTSMPPLTEKDLDIMLDFDAIRAAGTFLGAGGMIVLDDSVDAADVTFNIERFLAHESCGQCTPCREGSFWTERIMHRLLHGHGEAADLVNLKRVGENITGKVICALGDTVGMVTRAWLGKFPKDFESKVGAKHG
jgi:NADH-quinone oxidoreductase subunit F